MWAGGVGGTSLPGPDRKKKKKKTEIPSRKLKVSTAGGLVHLLSVRGDVDQKDDERNGPFKP